MAKNLGFAPGDKGEPTNPITFSICGAGWQGARSRVIPALGQWYYLVGTWDLGGIRLYVNGALAATSTAWRGGVPAHPAVLIGPGAWVQCLAATMARSASIRPPQVSQRALSKTRLSSHAASARPAGPKIKAESHEVFRRRPAPS